MSLISRSFLGVFLVPPLPDGVSVIRDGWGQHYGSGMMDWCPGWGMMGWFGPVPMILFLFVLLVAAVYVVRGLSRSRLRDVKPEESALDILKKRYVRGEINREEFEEKKRDLSG